MATVAPVNPIEVNFSGEVWTNITNGDTRFDGKRVLVSAGNYQVAVEKLSSATPNTKGTILNPFNALPPFTKTAGYDIWAYGGGSVRVEVIE